MKNLYSTLFSLLFMLFSGSLLTAQSNFFTPVDSRNIDQPVEAVKNIKELSVFRLNEQEMRAYLENAPMEFQNGDFTLPLEVPLPNGKTETFQLVETSNLSPELAVKFPDIKTYTGNGKQHPAYIIRINLTSLGLSAVILNVEGDAVYFEHYSKQDKDYYFNYFTRDAVAPDGVGRGSCGVDISDDTRQKIKQITGGNRNNTGSVLYTFRLVLAANGEFTQEFGGGTQGGGLAAVTNYVNSMNLTFINELSVKFELVANNNLVIYTNPGTDPYSNDTGLLLDENGPNLNTVIGNANFDVGHVLGYDVNFGSGGGLAGLGVICTDFDANNPFGNSKASGASVIGSGYGQVFYDQLLQHEMGHQFGMNHSYNSVIPVCTSRNPGTSVEPGAGATIMSYGFTCGDDDYFQSQLTGPILRFHTVNYEQAYNTIIANSCYTSPTTGNSPPVVTMPSAYTIPISTPFALTGSATDPNGDPLTYSWEGTNIATSTPTATTLLDPAEPPFFRTYEPVTSPTRTYPLLSAILDGTNQARGDKLPSVGIVTIHRLTVRDNVATGGGLTYGNVSVTVNGNIGPFLETTNLSSSYPGNSQQTITWSVNGTNVATPTVNILLSTDGGFTFPTTLAAGTGNDGSEVITLPNINTTMARIKVEAVGNIFFDISNINFSIFPSACPTGNILYVNDDASGNNDGTSWADAFTDLQDALASTCPGINQIWVAEGTYKPTSTTDRFTSFVMKNNLAILGGFPNTGNPGIGERDEDPTTNGTILSGDIDGDNTLANNNYHIIFNNENGLNSTAVLDGFTITGGNADGSFPNGEGGGMFNQNSSPTVTNCSFSENSTLGNGVGGGMSNRNSSPTLTNCSFSENTAFLGGGMFNQNSSPTVANCSFSGNSASGGGGMSNNNSSPMMTNCSFSGNSASVGGGMDNRGSSPTLTNCSFSGNSAPLRGGGMYNEDSSSPTVTNCIFWGNSSEIIEFADFNAGVSPIVTYSIVQQSSGVYPGTGNLNVDPLFVSQPPIGLGSSGDLRLQDCSPAIDAGTALGAPNNDLDGNTRPVNAAPNQPGDYDMGAYEFQGTVPGPTPVCASNLTVQLETDLTATVTAAQIGDSSDGCGELSFLIDGESSLTFDCDQVGPQTVTLQVTDLFMNMETTTCSFTVADDVNTCCDEPIANCQAFTAVLVGNSVTVTPADVDAGSTADCGLAALSVNPNTFGCADVGTPQTVTLTITDINGDSDACQATVTVVDNTPPTAVCIGEAVDVSVIVNDIPNATGSPLSLGGFYGKFGQTFQATATGLLSRIDLEIFSTTTAGVITLNLYPGNTDPNNLPTTPLGTASFAKSDPGGATVPLIFDSPVAITAGTSYLMIVTATGEHKLQTAVVTNGDPYPNGTFYDFGINTNSFQPFPINDIVLKTYILSPGATSRHLALDAGGNASLTAADLDGGSSDNCGAVTLELNPTTFSCSDIGAPVPVTLTVTDGATLTAECTVDVTVVDPTDNCVANQPPTIDCQPVQLSADATCVGTADAAIAAFRALASDPESASDDLTVSISPAGPYTLGETAVTVTVTDPDGAQAEPCVTTITVVDDTQPTFTCPPAMNVSTTGNADCEVEIPDFALLVEDEFDNCGLGDNVLEQSIAAGAMSSAGDGTTITVELTLQDNATGAPSTDPTTVWDESVDGDLTSAGGFSDNTAFTPVNLYEGVNIIKGTLANIVDFNGGTNADALSFVIPDGASVTALTATPTFQNGNTSSNIASYSGNPLSYVSATFTSGPAAVSLISLWGGSPLLPGDYGLLIAENIVEGLEYELSITCSGCPPPPAAGGNVSAPCSVVLTVVDNDPPTAVCQNITVNLETSGLYSLNPAELDGGSTDNCGAVGFGITTTVFDCDDVGSTFPIELSVSDNAGNFDVCTATVTVQDSTVPSASNPATITVQCDGDIPPIDPAVVINENDNCGVPTVTFFGETDNGAIGNATNPRIIVRTYQVTDASGNAIFVTHTINVIDDQPPMAICQDITVNLGASGIYSLDPNELDGGSTDNCAVAGLGIATTVFDCDDVGSTFPIELAISDISGNFDLCTANVTVTDPNSNCCTAPEIIAVTATPGDCPGAPATITVNGTLNDATEWVLYSDECGGNVLDTSTDGTFSVPDAAATYYVRAEGGCVSYADGSPLIWEEQFDGGIPATWGLSSSPAGAVWAWSADGDPYTVTLDGTVYTATFYTANSTTIDSPSAANGSAMFNADAYSTNGTGGTTGGPFPGAHTSSMTSPSVDCSEQSSVFVQLHQYTRLFDQATLTLSVSTDGGGTWTDFTVANNSIFVNQATTIDISSVAANQADVKLRFTWSSNTNQSFYFAIIDDVQLRSSLDDGGSAVGCTEVTVVPAVDNTPPIASCQDITVQLDANGNASFTASPVDNASNDACGIADRSVSPNSFICNAVGSNIVTLTVTDNNNNSATCTANVAVEDNIPPNINCPSNEIIQSAPGGCSVDYNIALPTANDNCGITVLRYRWRPTDENGDNITDSWSDWSTAAMQTLDVGYWRIEWQAKDASDNENKCSFLLTVEDDTPPTALCKDVTVQLNASGSGSLTANDIDDGSFDNCGIASSNINGFASVTLFCNNVGQANMVQLNLTDVNGNPSSCLSNVAVEDNVAPNAICQDVTVELDASGSGSTTAGAVDNGSSDACGIMNLSLSQTSFGCGEVGPNAVTLMVTDNNGNTSSCPATVTVEDNIDPTISFTDNIMLACSASTDPADLGPIIVSDNCTAPDEIMLSFSDQTSGVLCDGQTITRTITATDLSGNSTSEVQTINIATPVAPTITCPDLMVVECFADINPSADNAIVTTECTDGVVMVSAPMLSSGTADCNGAIYTVTYTVTDGCGQTASCEQDFAIVNDGPTIDCAADETVECVEDINPTEADVAVTTSCDVASDIDISEATVFGQDGCSGTVYQFTYTVTDVCGREASCTRSYTLENDGPEIMAPADETVECASDINFDAEDAEVEYACALDGDVEVSGPIQDGDDDCPGTTYTYTYTVTDECGRVASDEQVFTIQNAGPTIASPADQTVECAADISTDASAAVVTTSCTLGSSVVISGPVRLGPENCPGTTYTYTYIVTDDCGRTASNDQVFTIGENDGPTIAVVPSITVDCFESINPNPNLADVTTACGNGVDFSVAVTDPVLSSGLNCPGESYSVIYTVTDACGRTADATQTFTIANDGPTMECPDNCEVLSCYDGDYNAVIEAWLLTVTASSSCSMELTVSNDYNGVDGICVGDYTPVNFIATDACGRTATCESLIYIIDTDAPDIIGEPSELLVPCTGVTEDIFSDWLATRGGVEAYDACYEDDITWSTNPANPMALLDCSNGPQAIVVEFIVTDGCGNSASVTGVFNTKLLPNAVNVAGLIQTEAAEAVSSVEVSAYQSTGMAAMDLSDDNGDYNFEELPYEENTEIVPSRDGDYLNGVSTYDLILMQQHILDIQNLDSPYKRIAADVNRSGTISTLDLVLLRRLILHIDEELADNTSWRFVDADFVFPNPANPFETDFPEAYNLSGEEEELKDFVAVKIGDLNLDAWTSSYSQSDDRSGLEELIFEVEDQKLKAGETYAVEINAQNFEAIRGFQMTLDYDDSQVEVLDIEGSALPDFSEANYNLAFTKVGQLPISWNDQLARDLSFGDAAFSIIIKANADIQLSEVLSISSSLTKAEAYNSTDLMNVNLNFTNNGVNVASEKFELFQNTPNPFKATTTISFQLPEAGEVTLEVYDVAGKLIHVQRGDFAAGFNQIDVNRSDLQAGILYYQVSTAMDSESKKMIVIE